MAPVTDVVGPAAIAASYSKLLLRLDDLGPARSQLRSSQGVPRLGRDPTDSGFDHSLFMGDTGHSANRELVAPALAI
jgi:hypothetical protein